MISKVLVYVGLAAFSVLLCFSAYHMSQLIPDSQYLMGLCAAILCAAVSAEAIGTGKALTGQNTAAGLIFALALPIHAISWHTSQLAFLKGMEESSISEQQSGTEEQRFMMQNMSRQINQAESTKDRALINSQMLSLSRDMAEGQGQSSIDRAHEIAGTTKQNSAGLLALAMELAMLAVGIALGDYLTPNAGMIRREKKDKATEKEAKPKEKPKRLQLVQPKTLGGKEVKMSIPAVSKLKEDFIERSKDEIPDMLTQRKPSNSTPGYKRAADFEIQYQAAKTAGAKNIAEIKKAASCNQDRANAIRDRMIVENIWLGKPPRRLKQVG